MRLVTRDQMRALDRAAIEDYGVPGLALMERAGRAVVREMSEFFASRANLRAVVLCGKGNNGGDGYVIARHLRQRGAAVVVFALDDPAQLTGDAYAQMDRYRTLGAPVITLEGDAAWLRLRREVAAADVVVDALVGTGFRGAVEGALLDVCEIVNAHPAFVVAVDVPSGLDADTGAIDPIALLADLTVTFECPKLGCTLEPGRGFVGELRVADIGIPRAALEAQEPTADLIDRRAAALLVPTRHPTDHKGDCGRVLVIGGSAGMTGSVALAARAALATGAGLVTLAVPAPFAAAVDAALPEVMVLAVAETGRGGVSVRATDDLLAAAATVDAVALGPGMTRDLEPAELIRHLVSTIDAPLVLDADGLNAFEGALAELAEAPGALVLTPHVGEFSRLTGIDALAVEADRPRTARFAADTAQQVVLLKGSPTVIASTERPLAVAPAGNPGMATAGAGDVLTGVLAAWLSQGLVPFDAAVLGAFVHGAAGDLAAAERGVHGMMAGDIVDRLPQAIASLVAHGDEMLFGGD